MTIKFDLLRTDISENYLINSIQEDDFWIFGSFANDEESFASRNTERTQREFLEKTVFGVSVTNLDVAFLANLNLWQQGVVYTEFDDTVDLLIATNPFYVIVEQETTAGLYHIFKCIENNYGMPSIEKPIFQASINSLDGIYKLSDGYIWKYMLSVSEFTFMKFGGRGFFPIIRNQQVESISEEGIFSIKVENPNSNFGYERVECSINKIELDNTIIVSSIGNIAFNKFPNIYKGRTFYANPVVNEQLIGSRVYKIIASGERNNENFLVLDTVEDLSNQTIFEIIPTIEIKGTGEDAIAIPLFDANNNRITSVRMLDNGINYENATAIVVKPFDIFDPTNPNRSDVECILRPIISPTGGHGSDPIKELKSKSICISVNITSKNASNIPSENTYRKIGLVKNPTFSETITETTFDNRLELTMDDVVIGLNVGDIVTQNTGVSGAIHSIENDVIYLHNFYGAFSEEFSANTNLQTPIGEFGINTITKPKYIGRTGSVLFISDFTPIERTEESSEKIKLIIDF